VQLWTSVPHVDLTATHLEPIFMASFPSSEKRLSDSVVVRSSALPHRRVNAAWVTGESADPGLIGDIEEYYESLGQDPIFKVADAPKVDRALLLRGYQEEGLTPVFGLAHVAIDQPPNTVLSGEADLESALRYWMEFTQKPIDRLSLYLDAYQRSPGDIGVAFCIDGLSVAAVGMAHLYQGVAAISNVAVSPSVRRRGLGGAVTAGLMSWSASRGVETTVLQVEADNQAAMSLYQDLGFEKLYDSWYLRKPREPVT
jgi:ribosomal protein S18 acetylase RimI-like enzyme